MPEAYYLDASAPLAYLQREPGWERVRAALREGAVVSAVNLAEVSGKLKGRGKDPERLLVRLLALGLTVVPFTLEEARLASEPDPVTRVLGFSLGDLACLTTAARLGTAALIADRAWKAVPEIWVEVIREVSR